jgi:hypothetical protein
LQRARVGPASGARCQQPVEQSAHGRKNTIPGFSNACQGAILAAGALQSDAAVMPVMPVLPGIRAP